jgi:rod shape-determining protein MreB
VFSTYIYIKIHINKITVRNVNTKKEMTKSSPVAFSSERLLVGNFTAADELIKLLIKEIAPRGFISLPHIALVHPLEIIEGGLCQVEDRLFKELALGSGARKAKIYIGAELNDDAVLVLLN